MKQSPYGMQLKATKKFTRTFANYEGSHFRCSCGLEINVPTPEKDLTLPVCPDLKENEQHIVTANEPQLKFDMTFRLLNQIDAINVQDYLNEMAKTYVYGTGVKGSRDYAPPIPLPPVAGKSITVSESVCQIACILYKAQLMPTEEMYSLEELISWMTSDSICEQMLRVSLETQVDSDADPFVLAA
jgi:hypothetical protein